MRIFLIKIILLTHLMLRILPPSWCSYLDKAVKHEFEKKIELESQHNRYAVEW